MVAAREDRFTSASDRVVAFSAPPFCPVRAAHSARASACCVRPCTVRAQRCRCASPAPPPAICTSSMTTWNCAAGSGPTCATTATWFGTDRRAPPSVTRTRGCGYRAQRPASICRAACRLSAPLHVLVLVAISHEHLHVVVHAPRRLPVPRVSRSPSSAHARAQACTPRRCMPRRALWTGLTPAPPVSLFAVPPEWRARCR